MSGEETSERGEVVTKAKELEPLLVLNIHDSQEKPDPL